MILIAVLVNVSIYALGVVILSGFGNIMAAVYLLYCLGVEIHVLKRGCHAHGKAHGPLSAVSFDRKYRLASAGEKKEVQGTA